MVAEGIEREQEMRIVMDCGAKYGQGYYFAHPAHPAPGVSEALIEVDARVVRRSRAQTESTGAMFRLRGLEPRGS